MSNIRVLIVDDHPVVRDGIKTMIEADDQIEVIADVGSGKEALDIIARQEPDIVLLDMEMPGLSGVEVARQLKQQRTTTRILALSAYDDTSYIQSLLQDGAAGYLTKDEAPEFIIEAIHGIWRGQEGWLSRRVAARLTVLTRTEEQDDYGLTKRELQVLKSMVSANTNQEIGLELGISDKTVEKHLESIYQKLGVASRVEAAVLAVREDLIG